MSDTTTPENLPERLREQAIHPTNHVEWQRLRNEAADEIERLREALALIGENQQ